MRVEFEFFNASEKHPTKSGKYLCVFVNYGYLNFCTLAYSKKHDAFNAHDDDDPEFAMFPQFWAEFDEEDERFGGGATDLIESKLAEIGGAYDV
jgi:hypothetical protein